MVEKASRGEKLRMLREIVFFKPKLSVTIVSCSVLLSFMEGIGISFILPIVRVARRGTGGSKSQFLQLLEKSYDLLGVPFELEFLILGVLSIIAIRYTLNYIVSWLSAVLEMYYLADLREEAFTNVISTRLTYFDSRGSDEMLNTIITETEQSRRLIYHLIRAINVSCLVLVYTAIALYISPILTIATVLLLGGSIYVVRYLLEAGSTLGRRLVNANEQVQLAAQAVTHGIHEVKHFRMRTELVSDFRKSMEQFTRARVRKDRNSAIISNSTQFIVAASIFVLIYLSIEIFSMSVGALGVFLFAIFRLGPRASNLNDILYEIDSTLPHAIQTQNFIEETQDAQETHGGKPTPDTVETISYENVSFAYDEEPVLRNVSFQATRDEFVAFVGPSGAGKSSIVALLTRLYDPDSGDILADGTPIDEFDIEQWRSHVAVVRQNPFIFNTTLRRNLTVGNRDATAEEISRACDIAAVTEFLDDLPAGLDTQLGDDGVRLSGGQRQRVAIARALLQDSDFLVLDEATSDLDSHLEQRVHRAVEEMDDTYGIIAIAHQLSTVTDADRICVIEDGRIEDMGTHEQLLAREGRYAELYQLQTRAA